MRILELFSGSQSLAKVARAQGHEVVTLDICPRHNPTICTNILAWDPSVYPPDYFQYIHASVPCENYSICRTTGGKRSLELADSLVEKTLAVLSYFSTALWTVENPASSMLWKRPVARPLLEQLAKTSYCRYDFDYRKNTWFANNFGLELRPQCDGTCTKMVGRGHREYAQKGINIKKKGAAVQCNHTLDQLHSIPPGLCADVIETVEKKKIGVSVKEDDSN